MELNQDFVLIERAEKHYVNDKSVMKLVSRCRELISEYRSICGLEQAMVNAQLNTDTYDSASCSVIVNPMWGYDNAMKGHAGFSPRMYDIKNDICTNIERKRIILIKFTSILEMLEEMMEDVS